MAVPVTFYLKGDDYSPANGQPNGDLSAAGIGDIRRRGQGQVGRFGASKEFTFALLPGSPCPPATARSSWATRSVTGRLRAITRVRPGELPGGG